MDEPRTESSQYCTHCGEPVRETANYCHYCGNQFAAQSKTDQSGWKTDSAGNRETAVSGHSESGWGEPAPTDQSEQYRDAPRKQQGEEDGWGRTIPTELTVGGSAVRSVGAAVGLGISGIFALGIVTLIVGQSLSAAGAPDAVLTVGGLVVGQYTGFVGLGLLYFKARRLTFSQIREYLGVRMPTLREIGVVIAGYAAILGLLMVIGTIVSIFLPEPASNQAAKTASRNPSIIPVLIVGMFLVVGPCEEFLYRGVVQNRLRERFSAPVAIGIGSAVFASVHVIALLGQPASAIAVTIFVLFFPATVFGFVYEYTGNLVVPVLLHALHNSVIFSVIYYTSTTGSGQTVLLSFPV